MRGKMTHTYYPAAAPFLLPPLFLSLHRYNTTCMLAIHILRVADIWGTIHIRRLHRESTHPLTTSICLFCSPYIFFFAVKLYEHEQYFSCHPSCKGIVAALAAVVVTLPRRRCYPLPGNQPLFPSYPHADSGQSSPLFLSTQAASGGG